MNKTVMRVLQITLILVFAYLVVVNWRGATAVIRSSGNAYIGSVKALQGR